MFNEVIVLIWQISIPLKSISSDRRNVGYAQLSKHREKPGLRDQAGQKGRPREIDSSYLGKRKGSVEKVLRV